MGFATCTPLCRAVTAVRREEGCNKKGCDKDENPQQTSRDATSTSVLTNMVPIARVLGLSVLAWDVASIALCPGFWPDRRTQERSVTQKLADHTSKNFSWQPFLPRCMRGCLRCGYTFAAFVLLECLVLFTQESLGDFPRKMGRGQPFGGKAKKEQLKAKKAAKREQAETAGDEVEWGSRARKSGAASRQQDPSNAQEGARQPRQEGRGGGILIAPRNKLRTVFEREPQVYFSPPKAYAPLAK
jgi:hypothetical protein